MRSVGQKQGRVPRRIAESIPARHAVACRLTGSRILSIARATPSVLADRPAAFLRRPSLHAGCLHLYAPSHICTGPRHFFVVFSCIQPCFHLQPSTWRCRHVRSWQTQDQNEDRPCQESTRPHNEPLTIIAHTALETGQRHTQLQCIRPANEPLPVHPSLANSRTGTCAQVGIRVACRD